MRLKLGSEIAAADRIAVTEVPPRKYPKLSEQADERLCHVTSDANGMADVSSIQNTVSGCTPLSAISTYRPRKVFCITIL